MEIEFEAPQIQSLQKLELGEALSRVEHWRDPQGKELRREEIEQQALEWITPSEKQAQEIRRQLRPSLERFSATWNLDEL